MQANGCNESLASALDIAQSRIRTQSGQLDSSEADTRYILIEPILSALGWDTIDTRSVRREYSPYPKNDKRHRRRLDYVLFVSDIPRIVVEAKSLNYVEGAKTEIADLYCKNTLYTGIATDGYTWSIWQNQSWINIQIGTKDACKRLSIISKDSVSKHAYKHETIRILIKKFKSCEPRGNHKQNTENTNKAVQLFTKFVVKNKDTFKSSESDFRQMERAYLNILLYAKRKTTIKKILHTLDGLDVDAKEKIIEWSKSGKYASITRTLRRRSKKYRDEFLELIEIFQASNQYDKLLEKLKTFVIEAKNTNVAALTGILSSLQPEHFMVYNKRSSFPLKGTIREDLTNVDMSRYWEFNEMYRQISQDTDKSLIDLDGIANHMYRH